MNVSALEVPHYGTFAKQVWKIKDQMLTQPNATARLT